LDSQILKALHTRSRLKRESQSFGIKNGTASTHFKKENIRRMILKSRGELG